MPKASEFVVHFQFEMPPEVESLAEEHIEWAAGFLKDGDKNRADYHLDEARKLILSGFKLVLKGD